VPPRSPATARQTLARQEARPTGVWGAKGFGKPPRWLPRASFAAPLLLAALGILANVGAQPCLPPPPGLAGWWPGNGAASDFAGTNNGTLRNGASFAPGFVGQAFALDGLDD